MLFSDSLLVCSLFSWRKSRHLLALRIALLMGCIAVTSTPLWAATFFAGIDVIQALPPEGNIQKLQVQADLPFDYQVIPLRSDAIIIRLLNARISTQILESNGNLIFENQESVINKASLHLTDTLDIEEVLLTGANIGSYQIILEGGNQVPVDNSTLAKYQKMANAIQPVADVSPKYSQSKTQQAKTTATVANTDPLAAIHPQSPLISNGLQFPFSNLGHGTSRNNQNQVIETTAEASLPQQAPIRLPRPSFQPRVEGEPIGYNETNQTENRANAPSVQNDYQSVATAQEQSGVEDIPLLKMEPQIEQTSETSNDQATSQERLAINLDHAEAHQDNSISNSKTTDNQTAIHLVEETQPYKSNDTNTALSLINTPPINTLAYSSSNNVQTTLQKAKEQFDNQRYDTSEETLEAALRESPNEATLYAALGELYIKQHRYPNAQMAYGQAYQLKVQEYALRYAQVLVLTHQPEQAVVVLKKLLSQKDHLSKNPTEAGNAYYILGTLYEEKGDTLAALPYLEQAVVYLPDNADAQYNLALAYELSGKVALAKAHYSKATQLNPSAQDAQQALQRVKQYQ